MKPSQFARRVGIWTILVLVVGLSVILVAWPAHAQDATSAAPVTPNSVCEEPATGKSRRTDLPITGAFKNQRVDADGYWEYGCTPPAPPKDCPEMTSPRWFASGAWCDPLQPTIHAGNLGQVRRVNQAGFKGGWRDYQCLQRADGVKRWVPLRSTCR